MTATTKFYLVWLIAFALYGLNHLYWTRRRNSVGFRSGGKELFTWLGIDVVICGVAVVVSILLLNART